MTNTQSKTLQPSSSLGIRKLDRSRMKSLRGGRIVTCAIGTTRKLVEGYDNQLTADICAKHGMRPISGVAAL